MVIYPTKSVSCLQIVLTAKTQSSDCKNAGECYNYKTNSTLGLNNMSVFITDINTNYNIIPIIIPIEISLII